MKTMTRRTYGLEMVNQSPDDWEFVRMEGAIAVFHLLKEHSGKIILRHSTEMRGEDFLLKCPYGQEGDQIKVKEASQIITAGLRAERVQQITGQDAMAEGIELADRVYGDGDGDYFEAIEKSLISHFSKFWDSLYAKRGYGWEFNPWTWVIPHDFGVKV